MLAVLVVSACSCRPGHREVRWPASPDTTLEQELWATKRQAEPTGARLPTAPLPPEPLPGDAPGISARAFEYAELWVAEVIVGEAPPDAALPLVVMLHGRGDRPRIPGGPFGRVPTPMRVLIPRGPLVLGDGFAWARHSVTQGQYDAIASDLIAAAARLAQLITHVRDTQPTAGSPIVTGFSQGAMLAWTLAVRHPDVVGDVIPIAGWVPPLARTMPPRCAPSFALHGVDDAIVPIAGTRTWVEELRAHGNESELREYADVGHIVSPDMNADFEAHLEQLLSARAPALAGGLGARGRDPEPIEPYEEPLELDLEQPALPEAERDDTPTAQGTAVKPEDRDGNDGAAPSTPATTEAEPQADGTRAPSDDEPTTPPPTQP